MFVMPANAGIQVCFQFKFKNRLDSGFRQNDGKISRFVRDDKFPSCHSERSEESFLIFDSR
jgi:hypothetical protein